MGQILKYLVIGFCLAILFVVTVICSVELAWGGEAVPTRPAYLGEIDRSLSGIDSTKRHIVWRIIGSQDVPVKYYKEIVALCKDSEDMPVGEFTMAMMELMERMEAEEAANAEDDK